MTINTISDRVLSFPSGYTKENDLEGFKVYREIPDLPDVPLPKKRSRIFLYTTVIVVNLMSLSAGISLTWSSPVLAKLNGDIETDDNPLGRNITSEEYSWIGSILSLGAISGPYLSGFISDRMGRKYILLLCSGLPNLAGFLILAFAKDIAFYYAARLMCGFALGNMFCILPNYVGEISEPCIRGTLSSITNFFLTVGLLIPYVVGPFVSIKMFNLICAVFPSLFIVLFMFFPETPYFLLQVKQYESAENSLRKFRTGMECALKSELNSMKNKVEESLSTRGTFLDIWRTPGMRKALVLSMGLGMFHQLSGINVILYYTQTIFEATGSKIPSAVSTMIIGGAQILASVMTPLLADTVGRRVTLLFSTIFIVLAEAPLGFYFFVKEQHQDVASLYWLPVTCLVVFIIAFRIGLGPLPFTIMAELFPPNMKLSASMATTCFCYLIAFIVTKYFKYLTVIIGLWGGFWFFTFCSTMATVFIYFYLPETKKKSFEEIQSMLCTKKESPEV